MGTNKYDLHEIEYSVQGWDSIMNTDMQKLDDVIPARIIGTLGETASVYHCLYLKPADGKWYKAQADGSKQGSVGLAIEGGDLDEVIRIHKIGEITNGSWNWTKNALVYVDPSAAGALTQSVPSSNIQAVGYAITTTTIYFFPSIPNSNVTTERGIGFCVPGALASGDVGPWIPMLFAGTIKSVYAIVKTASTVGAIAIDILKCTDPTASPPVWTTIFTTKITIDQDERTTETATVPVELNGTQIFAVDDVYRINVDTEGVGAEDLVVVMKAMV
jgi:hypothetical protein